MLPSASVLVAMLPQVLGAPIAGAHRSAGAIALLLLAGIVVLNYRRRRSLPADAILVPALAALAGSALMDPMAVMGIAYGVLVGLSLYGSWVRATILTVATIIAVPVALATNPAAGNSIITWHDPALLAMLPQLGLLSTLTRILYGSLVAQQRTSREQAILAESGSLLLSARTSAEISQAAEDTWVALSEHMPRLVALYVHRDGDSLTITDAVGLSVSIGSPLPVEILTSTASPGLRELAPEVQHWSVAALASTDSERFVLAGGAKPVGTEDFTVLRTLGQQLTMAYANCASRELLHHQAHHDQLTGLATRRLFHDTVTAQPGGVALLYIDLDDFKPVNDTLGHAAGDELLVLVAERLRQARGRDGMAARFGGDEFGVLITGVDDDAQVLDQAALIQRLLFEPVTLTGARVTVGASIGVARRRPGMTTRELLQSADAAMYTAKVAGKNRVILAEAALPSR
jgi:diguanylate cyclase (GGDEF)-like protein